MNQAFKYRLYPNNEQQQKLEQFAGATRWLWNHMLDLNQKQYQQNKKFIFANDMINRIPNLKKSNNWLKLVPSQSLQQKCLDLDLAMTRVWKSGFGFPKFKKKQTNKDSFRIPQTNNHIKINDRSIQIPKLGEVNFRYHRPIAGKLKSITVSRELDCWYVSILCEIPDVDLKQIDIEKTVGIDLGISDFATLSNGTKIKKPKFNNKLIKKRARQLAKKQKSSKNRTRAKKQLAKQYQKKANQQRDWLHKLSKQLVDQFDLICLEDLKTKDLVKGKKQKSLNRNIMNQGWGMFIDMLKYKAAYQGKHTRQINQYAPSSKTCHVCKHKIDKLALDMRNWNCPQCGAEHDRDTNAAVNIHIWGLMLVSGQWFNDYTSGTGEIHACEDTTAHDSQARDWHHAVSLKQEAEMSLDSR